RDERALLAGGRGGLQRALEVVVDVEDRQHHAVHPGLALALELLRHAPAAVLEVGARSQVALAVLVELALELLQALLGALQLVAQDLGLVARPLSVPAGGAGRLPAGPRRPGRPTPVVVRHWPAA